MAAFDLGADFAVTALWQITMGSPHHVLKFADFLTTSHIFRYQRAKTDLLLFQLGFQSCDAGVGSDEPGLNMFVKLTGCFSVAFLAIGF